MNAEQIQFIALKHFSQKGYEGTALSDIAEEAGLKKQSLYSHFKNKDDLFMRTFEFVMEEERQFMNQTLSATDPKTLENKLYQFLTSYCERFVHKHETQYWLRVSFYPPPHLSEEILEKVYRVLDEMESDFVRIFAAHQPYANDLESNELAIAYLGLLDAIFVELVYGGKERASRRLEASWKLFCTALRK